MKRENEARNWQLTLRNRAFKSIFMYFYKISDASDFSKHSCFY